jgi:hypothetical protein
LDGPCFARYTIQQNMPERRFDLRGRNASFV